MYRQHHPCVNRSYYLEKQLFTFLWNHCLLDHTRSKQSNEGVSTVSQATLKNNPPDREAHFPPKAYWRLPLCSLYRQGTKTEEADHLPEAPTTGRVWNKLLSPLNSTDHGTREMAQRLRILSALSEVLSSIIIKKKIFKIMCMQCAPVCMCTWL